MFPQRYFPGRMFAARYFPKVGAAAALVTTGEIATALVRPFIATRPESLTLIGLQRVRTLIATARPR